MGGGDSRSWSCALSLSLSFKLELCCQNTQEIRSWKINSAKLKLTIMINSGRGLGFRNQSLIRSPPDAIFC